MSKRKRKVKISKPVQAVATVERNTETLVAAAPFEYTGPRSELTTDSASERWREKSFWFTGTLIVAGAAILLRLSWLTLKPFHHDEGVNGFFLTGLFRDGIYKYDPSNYHGPTLYFFTLLSSYIFGLNDFSVRIVTAVFGILTVALVFSLRRYLGTIGTLFAASLVALSPGLTFFSRYFIHEILLVFFTFAIVVCVVKFIEGHPVGKVAIAAMSLVIFTCILAVALQAATSVGGDDQLTKLVARFVFIALGIGAVYFLMLRLLAWDNGRPIYVLLGAASAAMTFATKETAFISLGTMLIAVGCVMLWQRTGIVAKPEINKFSFKDFSRQFSSVDNSSTLLFLSILLFVFLIIVFFSSFFTYEKGVSAAFEAYSIWTKTGSKDHTQTGVWGYLIILLETEAPILILGGIGSFMAFRKSNNQFAMFAALWAFGLLAAYSIIPYKTPWIAINFVLPMALIAGYGINELINDRQVLDRLTGSMLATGALVLCMYQTIDLNFFRFDDEKIPYVYVHSLRSMDAMVSKIDEVAKLAGVGDQATIIITSPDNWPLPWTLHRFKKAAFFGSMVKTPEAEAVIGAKSQRAELDRDYSATHYLVGTYTLRPGVELLLYIRKNIAPN